MYRFANSGPGIRRLLQHMARAGATQAVCEATGGYERLLGSRLRAAGLTVQVAHPLRVRAFARAPVATRPQIDGRLTGDRVLGTMQILAHGPAKTTGNGNGLQERGLPRIILGLIPRN